MRTDRRWHPFRIGPFSSQQSCLRSLGDRSAWDGWDRVGDGFRYYLDT